VANKFCEHARASFSDHLDGQPLTLVQRANVALHRAVCPLCKRYSASLDSTREALSLLKDSPVEGEDKAGIK
jgi:hypothetical protein